MNVSLSDSDIRKFIKNIIVYDDLHKFTPQTLLDMLPVAILYQPYSTNPNMGHWTLIHKVPGSIEFFDSYGFKPDGQFREMEYQQPHHIARLLLHLMNLSNMSYNQYQLQRRGSGIATCGRWIIVRNMFSSYDLDRFVRAIKLVSDTMGISPDELAVKLTE